MMEHPLKGGGKRKNDSPHPLTGGHAGANRRKRKKYALLNSGCIQIIK